MRHLILSVRVGVVTGAVLYSLGYLLTKASPDSSVIFAFGTLLLVSYLFWGLVAAIWYFITGQKPV